MLKSYIFGVNYVRRDGVKQITKREEQISMFILIFKCVPKSAERNDLFSGRWHCTFFTSYQIGTVSDHFLGWNWPRCSEFAIWIVITRTGTRSKITGKEGLFLILSFPFFPHHFYETLWVVILIKIYIVEYKIMTNLGILLLYDINLIHRRISLI